MANTQRIFQIELILAFTEFDMIKETFHAK